MRLYLLLYYKFTQAAISLDINAELLIRLERSNTLSPICKRDSLREEQLKHHYLLCQKRI